MASASAEGSKVTSQPPPGAIVIWKRADSHTQIRKEDNMELSGTASEWDPSPAAKQAGKGALKLLQQHSKHYGSAIANIESVTNSDASPDPSDGDDAIAKAMLDLHDHRTRIERGEQHASVGMRERLAKAEKALGSEYMHQHSVGYANAQRNREAGIRY
jgi:hypothetical protein